VIPSTNKETTMRARLITLALLTGATVVVPMTAAQAAPTLCDGKIATIVGTSGPDVLHGTPERDVIAGLGGNDRILAGEGDDLICGGDGADRLRGEGGDDVLFAGKARWVDNRAGSGYRPDWLDGGPGDDTLEIGNEPVDRGDGISGVITFDTAPAGVVVDLAERSAVGDGNDTIFPRGGLRLVGTDADDVLSGSDYLEEIDGAGGADRIMGRGGDDHLYGDADGAEEGAEGVNDDAISGGAGKDVVIGEVGSDTLRGGPGLDLVQANGVGPNQVFGGEGDDFLYLTLGTGDHVKLLGGPGRDDVTVEVHPTVPGPGKVLVNLGIEQLALNNVFVGRIASTERLHVGADVPLSFYGSTGPDEVYAGDDGRLRAWGYNGNDVIWGSNLADRIDGGTGFDEVRGGLGQDTCLHAEDRRSCERLTP
jgi:Ca2+-binding RTX toxin-like protein